jgi:hypothetical protein
MRIRLTRSLFLGGAHAQKGSVREVAKPLADDLILSGSAVPVRSVWQVVYVVAFLAIGVCAVLLWCTARAGCVVTEPAFDQPSSATQIRTVAFYGGASVLSL